jgi:hypothetical protein
MAFSIRRAQRAPGAWLAVDKPTHMRHRCSLATFLLQIRVGSSGMSVFRCTISNAAGELSRQCYHCWLRPLAAGSATSAGSALLAAGSAATAGFALRRRATSRVYSRSCGVG